ncbi:hypothetical protein J2128_001684 [Methanomicrobium sp. W14]|nr:hypothetical protein [Methanomicrobium sp. W14]
MIPGNSFGYFKSNDDDKKVLKEVFRVLKPKGRLLLDISDGKYLKTNFVPRSWEWIDQNYFVCRERCLSSDRQRLVTREVITHVKKGVIADQFYSERLYGGEEISAMLKECDFHEISVENPLVSESRRNQDLGMMARRFLATAVVEKKWTPVVKSKEKKKSVVVVMGDPRLSDSVKPSCVFDDDDFTTINRMKKALLKIKGYNFTYFDNCVIMVEEYLSGKDISVGIIGNPPGSYEVLPIIEEDYSNLPDDLPKICGYEAKWDPDSPYSRVKSVSANLPEDARRFLVASCLKLFRRLWCRDYARFDWRLDRNNTPRLLEVNPNPGWCWDGHLAKMAEISGMTYQQMLEKIIQSADKRISAE